MSQVIATFFAILIAAFVGGFTSSPQAPPPIPNDVITQIDAPPVMAALQMITCAYEDGEVGAGTGVAIGENKIITDEHVIRGMTFCTFNGEVILPKQIKYKDNNIDLAVIEISTASMVIAETNCSRLVTSEEYMGIGYPAGFYQKINMGESADPLVIPAPVATNLVAMKEYEDFIPTKEDKFRSNHLRIVGGYVRPGMSGGPVFDKDWKVRGLMNALVGSNHAMIRELADTPLCKEG